MKHSVGRSVWIGFALAASVLPAGEHGAEIEEPVVVNHVHAAVDGHDSYDWLASVALDEQDNGVVVWEARGGACEPLVATTSNGGRTWSRHFPIKTRAVNWKPSLRNKRPALATDRQGTWITAWSTNDDLEGTIDPNYDILVARSTDNGRNWTEAVPISPGFSMYSKEPEIATDGQGTWGVAWDGGLIGFARSVDNGLTWEHWVEIAALDSSGYDDVALATDGSGNWVIAWSHPDVYFAFSTDDGATWSPPNLLAAGNYRDVVLAAHTNGTWVAVFQYYEDDYDLAFTRSVDVRNWSEPQPLNSDSVTDGWAAYDEFPEIRVDRYGHWLASWSKWGLHNLMGAESFDDGVTWTDLAPLHNDPEHTGAFDSSLADDGASNWLLVWTSINTLGGTILNDRDVLSSALRLPFSTSCESDVDGDGYGSPGNPFCPMGPAVDCADADLRVAPGARQSCDGINNDCSDPAWPSLEGTNEFDNDGDGLTACEGDCNDEDGHSWALPGDARNLTISLDEHGVATFRWEPPEEPGGDPVALVYDLICSEAPYSCLNVGPQFCIESDDADTVATDAAVPFQDQVIYYLVRAENGCPGPGNPGDGGSPPFRLVRVCD